MYKTNDNIFSSAWLKEIVQVFKIPRMHAISMKSKLYQNLFSDKIVIIVN